MDLFFQPKICWKAVGRNLAFSIVDAGVFLTAPASFISAGANNKYLLTVLCSSVAKYFIYKNSDTTGAGDIMLNIQSLVKFPVPLNKLEAEVLEQLLDRDLKDQHINQEIDHYVYKLYGFSKDEIEFINSQF